jgi:hypothetical protein
MLTTEQVCAKVERAFAADITLVRRPHGPWVVDLIEDFPIFCQVRLEANIRGSVTDDTLDSFIAVAGQRGLTVETITSVTSDETV